MTLETYFKAMIASMPNSPIEHPLVRTRMWLSEKLHERSPIFGTVEEAINATIRFAGALGMRPMVLHHGPRLYFTKSVYARRKPTLPYTRSLISAVKS